MQTDILQTVSALSHFINEEKTAEEQEYEHLYAQYSTTDLIDTGLCVSNVHYSKLEHLFYRKVLVSFQYAVEREHMHKSRLKRNDFVHLIKINDNKDRKIPILKGVLYNVSESEIQLLADDKNFSEQKLQQSGLCFVKAMDYGAYER